MNLSGGGYTNGTQEFKEGEQQKSHVGLMWVNN